jgi:6-phosphofructokinase 1
MPIFLVEGMGSMRRIGILTGGGDAPGLNAVIRAAVKTAITQFDCEVIGIEHGFDGFFDDEGIYSLDLNAVRGILPRGGTILGAANRGNPFAREVVRDGQVVIEDVSDQVVKKINQMGLDALIVVGGDGTLKIGLELFEKGVPIIGVPKTIDNDVNGTEITFGFDTALNIATEAIDRLHTTAESHHRVMVLELMGRDAGFIALHAGVAGGADVILIPEIPFRYEKVNEKILDRVETGRHFSIVAVSEGACPEEGEKVYRTEGDEIYVARLGGISYEVGRQIEEACNVEVRVTVLGHIQRGGTPSAFDRWLATRYGAGAVRLAAAEGYGRMVSLQDAKIVDVALKDALRIPKRVDPNGDAVLAARGVGVSFGDE